MTFTHKVTRGWVGTSGDPPISKTITVTGDTVFEETVAVLINADRSVILGIRKAGLHGMVLSADQAMVITFKDGAGSPATVGTITLVADNPYMWTSSDDPTVSPNPLSANSATMHINSAAVGVLQVRAIWDSA